MNLWKKNKKLVSKFVLTHPLIAFFAALGFLLLVILVGNFLRRPPRDKEKLQVAPRAVEVFSNSEIPMVTLMAKIEKTGALSIYAQSAGVVQAIHHQAGEHVASRTPLFSLSTNYQDGNAASLSRQIAGTSYQAILDNYDQQKDLIAKQRVLANSADGQITAMRDISRQSVDDTNSLIDANQGIVDSLGNQIRTLEATNINGSNTATITSLQQAQAGAMSALLSLRSSERTLQYQTDTTKEPTVIADTTRDLTNEQLDLQQNALDLNREVAQLNLKLSQVMESLMYPSAPVAGTVERVFVHVGQAVNPGTMLATIRADKNEAQAIVLVDDILSTQISSIDPSIFKISGKQVSVRPQVIAKEPTESGLHAVTYTLPSAVASSVSGGTIISVSLPLATTRVSLVVPLRAVYQTPEKTYVYIVGEKNNQSVALLKEVILGDVYGEYAPVISGISKSDKIILTRSVKDGDVIAF